MLVLGLMAALLVKHFIFDFPFQFKFMLEGKGRYLAKGGIYHAVFHGLGTAVVFAAFGFVEVAATLAVMDMLIHYHIDYGKGLLNKYLALKPSDDRFWHLLGLDQLAHHMTYVLLAALALAK